MKFLSNVQSTGDINAYSIDTTNANTNALSSADIQAVSAIGIGGTSSTEALYVAGNMLITGNLSAAGVTSLSSVTAVTDSFEINSTLAHTALEVRQLGNDVSGQFYDGNQIALWIEAQPDSTAHVGIGVSNPTARLTVDGNITASENITGNIGESFANSVSASWDNLASYIPGNIVRYEGGYYICRLATFAGWAPTYGGGYWELIADAGVQGAQGTTGDDGAQGTTGDDGFQGSTGDDGAQGSQGADGTQGVWGPAGPDGAQGPQGANPIDVREVFELADSRSESAYPLEVFQQLPNRTGSGQFIYENGNPGSGNDIWGLLYYYQNGVPTGSVKLGILLDGSEIIRAYFTSISYYSVYDPVLGHNIDMFQVTWNLVDGASSFPSAFVRLASIYVSETAGETATGPQGAEGLPGADGAQGPQGADNSTPGAQGAQGPQGSPGGTGPAGGDNNVTGPQGPDGNPGPQGPQGAQGPQGEGPGARGHDGYTGPEGPQGANNYTQGPQGAANYTEGARGADGNVGPQGADNYTQGPQGEDNYTQGPQGDVGAQGPSGADNYTQGPQGEDNYTQGPQGDVGGAGSQGPAGPTGPQGNAGPQGATGNSGPAGANGTNNNVTGPQGPDGDSPAGPQGYVGSKGPQGPQGPAGEDAVVGGAQGPTGNQGPTGASGSDGNPGPQGADSDVYGDTGDTGDIGAQGGLGSQGAQGPQGDIGSQGSAGSSISYAETVTVVGDPSEVFTITHNLGRDVVAMLYDVATGEYANVATVVYSNNELHLEFNNAPASTYRIVVIGGTADEPQREGYSVNPPSGASSIDRQGLIFGQWSNNTAIGSWNGSWMDARNWANWYQDVMDINTGNYYIDDEFQQDEWGRMYYAASSIPRNGTPAEWAALGSTTTGTVELYGHCYLDIDAALAYWGDGSFPSTVIPHNTLTIWSNNNIVVSDHTTIDLMSGGGTVIYTGNATA